MLTVPCADDDAVYRDCTAAESGCASAARFADRFFAIRTVRFFAVFAFEEPEVFLDDRFLVVLPDEGFLVSAILNRVYHCDILRV